MKRNSATTIGDPMNAESFGYQPIDPLPVKFGIEQKDESILYLNSQNRIPNKQIMASLPDETMRLAIGELDGKGNVSFSSAKIGYEGSSYLVILDYIKFDTKSISLKIQRTNTDEIKFESWQDKLYDNYQSEVSSENNTSIVLMPVYVGVGLRFTASIKVNEGKVDLGNLFALGLAAESKKITGTMVIQTLGISGKDISALIPMPSQINTTTIQNSIMSLASIKAKIYEDSIDLNPRVIGFYNNIGGGKSTVHNFITNVLSTGMSHIIK
jgi:hypothetical protein